MTTPFLCFIVPTDCMGHSRGQQGFFFKWMHPENFTADRVHFSHSLLDDIATNIWHQELFWRATFPSQWLGEAVGGQHRRDNAIFSGNPKWDDTAPGETNKGG